MYAVNAVSRLAGLGSEGFKSLLKICGYVIFVFLPCGNKVSSQHDFDRKKYWDLFYVTASGV